VTSSISLVFAKLLVENAKAIAKLKVDLLVKVRIVVPFAIIVLYTGKVWREYMTKKLEKIDVTVTNILIIYGNNAA